MNERCVTAATAIAELHKMKKTVPSGSKLLSTNTLKNHIKSLRIEAAKAVVLMSTVSCPFVYIHSVLIIILYLAFLPLHYQTTLQSYSQFLTLLPILYNPRLLLGTSQRKEEVLHMVVRQCQRSKSLAPFTPFQSYHISFTYLICTAKPSLYLYFFFCSCIIPIL